MSYSKIASRTPVQWINYLTSKGAPKKLIDQIKAIERSGKEYGRSKAYIMRTIIDKIPKRFLEEPTKVHGPEKSAPLSEPTTKKSFELTAEDYASIEDAVIKIAGIHTIEGVSGITMNITPDNCIVKFNCETTKALTEE